MESPILDKTTLLFAALRRRTIYIRNMALDLNIIIEVLWGFILSFYYSIISIMKIFHPDPFIKSVNGDLVLITGGGSGLGRLMAQKLSKLGAVIVTLDVNKVANDETAKLIVEDGGECRAYTCDLSNRSAIYDTAARIKDEMGTVSILINNAGIVSGRSLLDIPDEKIQRTFDVNILAHFWTIKAFLPGMLTQKKGHIVNIASLAGHSGINQLTDYCASKFAAVGLDEALRSELDTQGHGSYIKTTVVCPYYINTGMFDGVYSKLIPILEPNDVVDKAIQGILTNTEIVIVPRWIAMLNTLKTLLPTRGFLKLSSAFGLNTSMSEFEGRKKED